MNGPQRRPQTQIQSWIFKVLVTYQKSEKAPKIWEILQCERTWVADQNGFRRRRQWTPRRRRRFCRRGWLRLLAFFVGFVAFLSCSLCCLLCVTRECDKWNKQNNDMGHGPTHFTLTSTSLSLGKTGYGSLRMIHTGFCDSKDRLIKRIRLIRV